MKKSMALALLLLLVAGCHRATQTSGTPLYVQLVRGNDQDAAPAPGSKPVGPVLDEKLKSVFRWKHYWELKNDVVVVQPGQRVRRRLTADRELEIRLLNPQHLCVRLYFKGHPTRERFQPLSDAFYVTGGEHGEDEAWFVVVRKDKPFDSPQG